MKEINLPITQPQNYLLKVLIGDSASAKEYYEKWVDLVNIVDFIDGESYKLLPMLYQKLVSLNILDENINKYKGLYKRTLFQNSMHLKNLYLIGKQLNEQNIPFSVIKGMSMLLYYYKNNALRYMNDIDIVVKKEHIKQTIILLEKIDFKSKNIDNIYENIDIRHSYTFSNKLGFRIDLHWKAIYLNHKNIDISETIPIVKNNIAMNILTPENQILNTLIHAISWDPLFTLRWIVDLHVILTKEKNINWLYIIEKVKNSNVSFSFYLMLEYFNKISDIKVDNKYIDLLKVNGNNRKNYIFAKKNLIHPKTVFGKLGWFLYSGIYSEKNIFIKLIYFPRYILLNSQYKSYTSLFAAFLSKYIFRKKKP